MAEEEQENIPEHSDQTQDQESAAEVPSDEEPLTGDAQEAEPESEELAIEPPGTDPLPSAPTKSKRFSTVKKVLAAGIVLIAAVLLYEFWIFSSPPPPSETEPAIQHTFLEEPSAKETAQKPVQPIQDSGHLADKTQEPVSLLTARTFYLDGDYDKAYTTYKRLHESLSTSAKEELMRDFLQLKMALCMAKAGDIEQADRQLAVASQSRCPAVAVVANYHLGLSEIQRGQYLKARTRAYKVLALIDAVDYRLAGDEFTPAKTEYRDWALLLQRNCHFLIAECLTREVLSLCDADKELPAQLWGSKLQIDPFTDLDETQLRYLLNSGLEKLNEAVLTPQIQQFKHAGSSLVLRWSVICNGASNDELLIRFAANAGLDINWACCSAESPQADAIRKRPVTLYLPAATTQEFVTTAAGCVGLLARLDKKNVIDIFNPADYSSLSEHISFLSEEAVSLWQRFLLVFHDDQRIANAHFALGLLHAQRDNVAGAIAEFKLVANRFSQTSLAPFALLHSSRLKAGLRDYSGSRADLKQLVELYPDSEIATRAYLNLAEATVKAELLNEAAQLYRKVYNLSPSSEHQRVAALGAGRCFYEIEDYQSASEWLTRYISLAKDRKDKSLYSAYLLLGKTLAALGKPQQACEAFQYALAGQLSREEYAEAVSALIKGYMEQEHFMMALDTLENLRPSQFSQKGVVEMLLLKCQILRAIGLVDKAVAELGDRIEYISDPQLKARMSLELANCHIAEGKLERANKDLTELLVLVEPGPVAHEIAVTLADVCLKLGRNGEAISVCRQLLDLEPSELVKQKALNILAAAYNRQKNYDQAALALLDLQPVKNLYEKNDL